MAEILAIVAFPIAAYDTVQAFYKAGKTIHERILNYQDAAEIVGKVSEFVNSIHDGDLQVQIEVPQWLFQQSEVRGTLKDNVSSLLKKLKAELVDICKPLLNLSDSQGEWRRIGSTIQKDKKGLIKEDEIVIEGRPIMRGNSNIKEPEDPKVALRPVTVLIEKLHDEGDTGLPEVQGIAARTSLDTVQAQQKNTEMP
ncbi:hypothetical protein MMC26_002431 [Xylographa opegraphella]|nr:hypothetical protein [Xylographa opegraphella]